MNLDLIHIVEAVGLIFTLLGALILSLSREKYKNKDIIAFNSFHVANMFVLYLAAMKDLFLLFIQMILFAMNNIVNLIVFYKRKNIKHRNLINIAMILMTMAVIVVCFLKFETFQFQNIPVIEYLAITSALYGITLMRSKERKTRVKGFLFFMLADIAYVYIGISNGLYLFSLQYVFLLGTSLNGIFNELKDSKKEKSREEYSYGTTG